MLHFLIATIAKLGIGVMPDRIFAKGALGRT